jgi:hypothetical protein
MEMDVMGLTMKKKESYGDRFIPSGIRTNAYDMMEENEGRKDGNLMKKTSVEFYQEYLSSHLMNK